MDPLLGTIQLFPFDFVPSGWHACDGAMLAISRNPALFSLLGTRFGGDGRVTFGVPKIDAPSDDLTYCIALVSDYLPPK